jgi:hypothetical protein
MNPLVSLLNQHINSINPEQAAGGAGLIFKTLQEKLDPQDFSTLSAALPGVLELIQNAPQTKSGGGLMGALGGLAGALGGNGAAGQLGQLGQFASLVGGFSKLGLSPDMIGRFLPLIMQYIQSEGGEQILKIAHKVLKG